MPNAVNFWADANQDALERLIYAIDQLRFAARRSADELSTTGEWGGLDATVDTAREAVAQAARAVSAAQAPPNQVMRRELAAFCADVETFNNPASFDEWVSTWIRAMVHWDAFFDALASATGQSPPSGRSG